MSNRKQPRLRAALGARLRALRKSKKLSQKGLGFASRMSGKFIGEGERGGNSGSLDSLARGAGAPGGRVHELVGVKGPPSAPRRGARGALARRPPGGVGWFRAIARAFRRSMPFQL